VDGEGARAAVDPNLPREQHLTAALFRYHDRFVYLVEGVGGGDKARDGAGGNQRREVIERCYDVRIGRLIPVTKPEAPHRLLPEN